MLLACSHASVSKIMGSGREDSQFLSFEWLLGNLKLSLRCQLASPLHAGQLATAWQDSSASLHYLVLTWDQERSGGDCVPLSVLVGAGQRGFHEW